MDVKPGSNGLSSRISIRGGGGSGSVLILVDGRPMGTPQYGGVDLGSIPIDIETESGRITPDANGQTTPSQTPQGVYF
ncbi:MAG: TonB-dependent receptor plug domain-containing protein [Proteobacteria bacterium]|nr:TonB-dependent receptor plug domain-containing protein [Pseudomonadota bacterium]